MPKVRIDLLDNEDMGELDMPVREKIPHKQRTDDDGKPFKRQDKKDRKNFKEARQAKEFFEKEPRINE